jgi:hypothetical protein
MRTRIRMACSGVLLLAVILLASACQTPMVRSRRQVSQPVVVATPSSAVIIEVVGTQGLRFDGSYGELGQPKQLAGDVPRTLTFRTGVGFSVAFQKRTQPGELGIKVMVDGKTVHESTTTKEYGVVTYTHRLPGK